MSAYRGKRCNVLVQCRDLWEGVKGGERWSKTWAMRAHAAAQRLELSLGAYADSLYSLTQVFPLHLYPGSIVGCLGQTRCTSWQVFLNKEGQAYEEVKNFSDGI